LEEPDFSVVICLPGYFHFSLVLFLAHLSPGGISAVPGYRGHFFERFVLFSLQSLLPGIFGLIAAR
jgi:hypothetical protein